jgi:hypothetical protein
MYQTFTVRNFRCFRETALKGLERVNLIAGMNNVGKTALLEALFVHCGVRNPELILRLNGLRWSVGGRFEVPGFAKTSWKSILNEFDAAKVVELEGEDEQTGHRLLRLDVVDEPEELAKIRRSRPPIPDNADDMFPLSSEMADVLYLETTERGKRYKQYMILNEKGVRNHVSQGIDANVQHRLAALSVRLA